MQICHGDSNLCEEAEYLRIATTSLVLDAIERGAIRSIPRIWFPVSTLRSVVRDVHLKKTIATYQSRKLTALEVQRFYLDACREFVDGLPAPSTEANEVLRRWSEVLDLLEHNRSALVGRVDWITKKYLIRNAGSDLLWEARKKIDLCYHELSAHGYFEKLKQTGIVERLVTEEEVERAMRNAPASTPAAVRGRYIREFADSDTPIIVDWQRIQLGEGRDRTVIETLEHRTGEPD